MSVISISSYLAQETTTNPQLRNLCIYRASRRFASFNAVILTYLTRVDYKGSECLYSQELTNIAQLYQTKHFYYNIEKEEENCRKKFILKSVIDRHF